MHRLRRERAAPWALMVVVEHWWDAQKELLNSSIWARVAAGKPGPIIAWVAEQQRRHGA